MLSRFSSRTAILVATVLALTACGNSSASKHEAKPGNTAVAKATELVDAPSRHPRSAVPPAPGTTLARINERGRVNVIANVQGQGFDVVSSVLLNETDLSTLQVHDVDGSPLGRLAEGSFTGECGAADFIADGRRSILTLLIKTVPAAGITQATHALEMNAWDARTGTRIWSAALFEPSPETISCQAYDGNLQNISITFDGKWGVLSWPRSQATRRLAIDLRTGQLYPRADLLGTIGNYVTIGTDNTVYSGQPNIVNLTVPGEWKVLGTFKSGVDVDTIDLPQTGNMAPTGLFYHGGTGDRTVSTPDGTTIVGVTGNGPHSVPYSVSAFKLPSAQPLWSIRTPQYFSDTIHAINASIVLVQRASNGSAADGVEYMAIDVVTGKVVWSQKIVDLTTCFLTSHYVRVRAKDQFATLDAATGKQLSYTSDGNSCPTAVATGLTGVGRLDKEVVQVLSP